MVIRYNVPPPQSIQQVPRRQSRGGCGCCLTTLLLGVLLVAGGVLLAMFLLVADGRTNVLVLGVDRRPEEGYAARADAIMIITGDPALPALGLFSVPRDLYLPIPGRGENRINTAHFFGELEQTGTGPLRTMQVIQDTMAVPLHGWVRIDFDGFRAVIDSVGGIDMDVEAVIVDDAYPTEDYGTMRIEIPAGLQHMDGEQALQYARTRHSSSDLKRAERQQKVALALVQQAIRPANWVRLPQVVKTIRQAVDYDVSVLSGLRLGLAIVRVGPEDAERLVIGQDMVTPYTTPGGAAVLLPNWDRIQRAVDPFFALQ
jgi:LCP family protein required for cell wall assembly